MLMLGVVEDVKINMGLAFEKHVCVCVTFYIKIYITYNT